jgi:hypothetical protein
MGVQVSPCLDIRFGECKAKRKKRSREAAAFAAAMLTLELPRFLVGRPNINRAVLEALDIYNMISHDKPVLSRGQSQQVNKSTKCIS